MQDDPLIMIVDDNPLNMKLIHILLTKQGYSVCTATNADEVRRSLQERSPRLILMDIQLPGEDGLSLTQQIKHNPATHNISIVALTAYAMQGDEEKALAAGCDGYIPKPIEANTFVHTIEQYLR